MSGVYVAYKADTYHLRDALNMVGAFVNNTSLYDGHVTLIYSMPDGVAPELTYIPDIASVISCISIFDNPTQGAVAIVAELEAPELQVVHSSLLATGLTHTFIPFKPHLSLGYGLTRLQAEYLIGKLTTLLVGKQVALHSVYHEPLDDTWN